MTTEQILPEGAPTHCDYCPKPPVVWIRGEADIPPGFQDPVHWLVACADHEKPSLGGIICIVFNLVRIDAANIRNRADETGTFASIL